MNRLNIPAVMSERSRPAALPSRSVSDELRRSAEEGRVSARECCGSESRGPSESRSAHPIIHGRGKLDEVIVTLGMVG